ncbi:MAG: DegQ family serine endoprotease [Leptospirales bacterium]
MKNSIRKTITMGAIGLAGLAVGITIASHFNWMGKTVAKSGNPDPPSISQKAIEPGLALQKAFVTVSDAVIPSVVNISTTSLITTHPNPIFNDPFFRQFFGGPFNHGGGGATPQKHVERSLGSGFIISKDGYIVTNYHVIKHATKVTVVLSDKSSYRATVIGKDPMTDVAVIRIHPKHSLPVIQWGSSRSVSVGTIVLAMGSPFGLTQSVTMGIVSALKRSNMGIEQYENFIQTDAAINPGNSGGPLVNLEGEVIGMNTAIYTTNGGYEGIGFAIPVDMVKRVLNDLMTKGKVVRGWLGVSIQNVTLVIAKQFHLPGHKGVLVSDVLPDSPASRSGMKRGDVILALNGQDVVDANDLRLRVSQIPPGTDAELSIIRNGHKKKVTVKVGELPEKLSMMGGQAPVPGNTHFNNVLNGIDVSNLDNEIRGQLNIPDSVSGVIIQGIAPGSQAEATGLKRGDIIQEIDRHPVRNVHSYIKIARHIGKTENVLLTIIRNGRHSYVSLSP